MEDILWIIARVKETIKIKFKVTFLEWFFLKRIMKKKRIEFLPVNKMRGQSFDRLIIDEFASIKW